MEGDMATQTKAVMATAGELLKAAGFGFEHVVSSRVYITDTADFQAMNQNYVPSFPKDPPARATVVAGLPGPTYKVEMTMTAYRGPKQAFTAPNPDGTPGKPSPTLSNAIKVGNRLYISGILGNTPENKGDMTAQTKVILERVGRTLDRGGLLVGRRCGRHRLHHGHREVPRDERGLSHHLHEGLPDACHGGHRAGQRRRPRRDHVRRVEVAVGVRRHCRQSRPLLLQVAKTAADSRQLLPAPSVTVLA